ncbi:MAG: hypothetical protein PHE73_01815 [Sulfurovaceae bacterium]|nr:hypothetical protein [Sulfurovaceae bacterium]
MANQYNVIFGAGYQCHVKCQQNHADSIVGAIDNVDNDSSAFWLFDIYPDIKSRMAFGSIIL